MAIRRDLAAKNREHRRLPFVIHIDIEMISARCSFGFTRSVIDKRPDPGVTINDVGGGQFLFEIGARSLTQIGNFFRSGADIFERAFMIGVGRTN